MLFIAEWHFGMAATPTQLLAGKVGGDPEYPSRITGLWSVTIAVAIHRNEYILGDVYRVNLVSQISGQKCSQAGRPPIHDFIQCHVISVCEAFHGLNIGIVQYFLASGHGCP